MGRVGTQSFARYPILEMAEDLHLIMGRQLAWRIP